MYVEETGVVEHCLHAARPVDTTWRAIVAASSAEGRVVITRHMSGSATSREFGIFVVL